MAARNKKDFKIAAPASGNPPIYTPDAPLYTLADNKDGGIAPIYTDKNWKDLSYSGDKTGFEKPHGEWNKLEVIVNKGTLEVFLNGKFVNKSTNFSPNKGRLQIQSEGAEIFYRTIDIEKL